MKKNLTIPLAMMAVLALVASSANAAGLSDAEAAAITQNALAKQEAEQRARWAAEFGVATTLPSGRAVMRIDFDAPGCEVKGPDGKPISVSHSQSSVIKFPRGATVTGACLVGYP